MKIPHLLSAILLIASSCLVSCQKEISGEILPVDSTGVTPGDTTGLPIDTASHGNADGLLRRSTTVYADTNYIITSYTYDANKKLSKIAYTGKSGGSDINEGLLIYRDANSRIVKTGEYFYNILFEKMDTTWGTYTYSTGGVLRSKVYFIGLGSIGINDSIIYTFDAGNKLTRADEYQTDFFSPVYEHKGYKDVTYNGNNLAMEKSYGKNAAGSLVPATTTTYQYDTKVTPYVADIVEYAIRVYGGYSLNNITGVNITDHSGAGQDATIRTEYKYAANGKPVSGKAWSTSGGMTIISQISLFYE